jgi:hypothetical protein
LIRVLAAGSLLLMALFWLVHEIDGERRVRIQEGGALIFARLKRERTSRSTSRRRCSTG